MTSSLSTSLFRELRPNFFGVLASPSARLYVDVLDALEREAGQRTQGLDRVEKDGIECSFSGSQVRLRLKKHKMGERPPSDAFVAELPKRVLKKFPLLVEFDSRPRLMSDRQQRRADVGRRPWTEEELKLIGTRPDREIARLLNRSLSALKAKKFQFLRAARPVPPPGESSAPGGRLTTGAFRKSSPAMGGEKIPSPPLESVGSGVGL